jgi:hypothetical protein
MVWRTAEPEGDRFRTVSLRHWLSKQGVPRHRQESLLVLASGPDILWVVGYRQGTQATVGFRTTRYWEMQAVARFRV